MLGTSLLTLSICAQVLCLTHASIYSFSKHFLSINPIPGTVLDTEDTNEIKHMRRAWEATNRKNGSREGFGRRVDRGWFRKMPKDPSKQCLVELVMKKRGLVCLQRYPVCVQTDSGLVWNPETHSEPCPETSWREDRKTAAANLPQTSASSNGRLENVDQSS